MIVVLKNEKVGIIQINLANVIFLFQQICEKKNPLHFEMFIGYELVQILQIYHWSAGPTFLAY